MTRLLLGTAPDSWGVWVADDPAQTPWQRFLDEVVAAGYEWVELGPYGYLPTDPQRLGDELAKRALKVAGGTVHGVGGLHNPAHWPDFEEAELGWPLLVGGGTLPAQSRLEVMVLASISGAASEGNGPPPLLLLNATDALTRL